MSNENVATLLATVAVTSFMTTFERELAFKLCIFVAKSLETDLTYLTLAASVST